MKQSLLLALTLMFLAPAAWAQNIFIEGDALSDRFYNSDTGPTNSQLTLDFTITQAGILQNIITWGENDGQGGLNGTGQSFEFLVLRPLNSTNYQVVFATGYLTVTNVGTNTFAISGTPFGLQVGDVVAHYGRGIPFSNGTGGPGSVYIAVNLPPPVLNTTITVPSATYPLYNDGGRNYAIQVQLLGQPFLVTTNSDNGPGSLRQAVLNANAFAGASTINFATNLSGQTILLTNAAGELLLSNSITIDASGLSNGISINGNGTHRVFEIASGTTAVLTGLTITNGSDPVDGNAGGIYNSGTLTVNLCKITGNASSYSGGGVGNAGTMTVNQSTISANTALFACGIENRGTMTLDQSTVSGHASAAKVAGIDNQGTLALNNSTVTGNSYNYTFHGGAGGIWNRGIALTLNNTTIANNSATIAPKTGYESAGGIVNDATLNMTNSIVAGNSNGSGLDIDNAAAIALGGANIVQAVTNDATFGGGTETGPAAINAAPFLAALGDYGGPTQTMPPLAGSPAIDAGIVITGLTTDQRGYPRLSGAHVDIGAVEVNTNTIVTTVTDNVPGSLRNVVAGALPSDLVSFAPNLSGQTITLTNGQIALSKNVTIDASALPGGIAINGNHASRIFSVNGGTVVLNSLTITNGTDAGNGGGGGMLNYTTLTLNNCSLLGNTASDPNWGGGGILSYNATLKLNNCTLAGNSADNTVGGGGIFIDSGTVVVNQSTLAVNSGNNSSGGGIFNYILGTLLVTNSIIAANTATGGQGPDVGNTFSSVYFGGSNLLQAAVYNTDGGTSSGSYITNAPLLAPLGNYGGPTPTMPPLPGSPAIDSGAATTLTTDQRGFPRVVGPAPDIGAVESGNAIPGFVPVVTTNSDAIYSIGAGAVSLREAVAFAAGSSTITFAASLSGQTIVLTNGQITIATNLTISGSALANGIQISGNHNSRIFNISTNGATLISLTMTNANGGGDDGGALYNAGNTVLNYCTFTGNSTGSGGAIKNVGGTLVLNECTLTGNSATGGGGGGIVNYAALFLNGCTLTGNSALGIFGGAIYSETAGHVTLNDTIAAGNTGFDIYNNGTLTLTGSNIVQNIAGGYTGPAPINASPQLAALGNYGGPTPTMPPLPGSPAIDSGADSEITFLPNDQRGYPRLAGAHADIGAVEGIYLAAGPGKIKTITHLGNGSVQFSFTNLTDAVFRVLATTNVSLSLSNWTQIGFATESPVGSGQFPFTDTQATNYPQRFYGIRSP